MHLACWQEPLATPLQDLWSRRTLENGGDVLEPLGVIEVLEEVVVGVLMAGRHQHAVALAHDL
eukprot:32975-Eustigmatos_ZCMA.PRE.1